MLKIKKASLGLTVLLTALLLFGLADAAITAPTLSATDVKAGQSITVSGGNFTDWNTSNVNISIDNTPLIDPKNDITLTAAKAIPSTAFTIPLNTAVRSGAEIIIVDSNNPLNTTAVLFNITNTAPTIVTTSLTTAYVGTTYSRKVQVSDDNGDATLNGCSLDNDGLSRLELVSSTPSTESGNKYCTLQFSGDGKPTSNDVGDYDPVLTVTDSNGGSTNKTYSLDVVDYLEITKVQVDDQTNDDDDHMPGDEIEVKVTVENLIDENDLALDDEELSDVEITVEIDELDIEVESDKFTLKDKGDKNTETITFIVPYDADEQSYDMIITVIGDDDDGEEHKATETETFRVQRDNHDLLITDVEFDSNTTSCGDKVTMTFDVINIGSTDEEDIALTITQSDLGIDSTIADFDLDEGDEASKEISFTVPENAYEDTFRVLIKAKYDDDDETLTKYVDLKLEDCKSKFVGLTLESSTINIGTGTKLSVSLENIGATSEDFEIKLVGVDKFGILNSSINLEEIEVDATGTKIVDIDLTSNVDAESGLYEIEVEIYKNSKLVGSKSIGLTLAKGGLLSGFATGSGGGETSLILGIVLILALIAYLGYQLWFKDKNLFKNIGDKKNKTDYDDDDVQSLIFEEEKPKQKRKKK